MSSTNVSPDAAFFFFFLVSLFVFVGLPVPGIGQVFLRIDISDANVNIAAYGKLALVTFCVHPPVAG